jgi:hypothetical protein
MESKELKITAGGFVTESELSKPAKLQMLNFIQYEASDHQLMALLLDGEIIELDELAEQIVENRFMLSEFLFGTSGEYDKIVGLVMGKCIDLKCSKLTNKQAMKICHYNCYISGELVGLKAFKQKLSNCKNEKNPERCEKMMNKRIKKIENNIKGLKEQLKKIKRVEQ